MKYITITIIISLYLISNADGQDSFCESWFIEPILYNNQISDSTHVEYWENYWYYRSGDNSKLIPDSLQIVLDLIPSMDILPKVKLADNIHGTYQIKSTLVFKYGIFDRSYNVISPKISEPILILNDTIDLEEIYDKIIDTDKMSFSYYPHSINLKKILDTLNISIEDGSWDFEKRGKPFGLNQIIISSYFINISGEVKFWSEFTFPVNGAYNNPYGGKWEY